MDYRAFDTALKRYRDGSIAYSVLERDKGRPPAIAVKMLPEAADDLLLRQAALNIGITIPRSRPNVASIAAIVRPSQSGGGTKSASNTAT